MKPKSVLQIAWLLFFPSMYVSASVNLPAIDDTVHILVIKEQGESQLFINDQVQILERVWNDSEYLLGNVPATLTIVNPGAALTIETNLFGNVLTQVQSVRTFVSTEVGGNPSLRDVLAADLVVAYVDTLGFDAQGRPVCGFSPQPNWGGPGSEYIPDPFNNFLDLRARGTNQTDGYYISLVSSDSACNGPDLSDLTAHEVGHLFGAGHYEVAGSPSTKTGLHDQSRSLVDEIFIPAIPPWIPAQTSYMRTVLGRQIDSPCAPLNRFCATYFLYSDHLLDNNTRRNTDSMDTTAVAVANYRMGVPAFGFVELCADGIDNDGDGDTDIEDSECQTSGTEVPPSPPSQCGGALAAPTGVHAFLVEQCASNPPFGTPSLYRIKWSHQCPQQVHHFEVWSEIPPGSEPMFEWNVYNCLTTDGLIDIVTAKVLIRACSSNTTCTQKVGGPIFTDIC